MRIFCLTLLLGLSFTIHAQKYFLFVGTYTGSGSKGIYVYSFDASTGKAEWISNTDSGTVVNPSFLATSPNNSFLYSCTETKTVNAGGISAFKFDKKKGTLSFINKQSSQGDNPAYVSVHPGGKWISCANYSGGSLSLFKVNNDGSLQAAAQTFQHEGHGLDKARQEKPHVHSTVFSPGGSYLFAADLGIDGIIIYRFNASKDQPIEPSATPMITTSPGSGPRHFEFHPNGKWAYLIEEMDGAVVSYSYNKGELTKLQEIPAHHDTATGEFGSADIHVSPDGKFLYASNRGKENNIAIFKIDNSSGKLISTGYQSSMGIGPRNFCIDPTGNYLLVANQVTGNIVIFKRDKQTGLLTPTGDEINIPKPVCLKMIKR